MFDGEGYTIDGLYVANGPAEKTFLDGKVGLEVFDLQQETICISNVSIHKVFGSSGFS